PLIRHVQGFGQNSSLANYGYKIRVRHPARQHVHMDVIGDASARGSADVHSKIDSIRRVELPQYSLHTLSKLDHFLGNFGRQLCQRVQMGEGDDHYMAASVWIGVQDDETMLAAISNVNPGVIAFLREITKNTAGDFSRGGYIRVSPWCPEIVHVTAA